MFTRNHSLRSYESSSAASHASLARFGSRIIRAKQPSAARVETADYVAKRKPAVDEAVSL